MAETTRQKRRIEAVATILASSHGFAVAADHGEGAFPLMAMAQEKRVGDRFIRANPRAREWVDTARKIIKRLGLKDLR